MPWPSLPAAARWFALLLSLGLLVLLGVAVALTPNERGFGTHQQLGFPQCTVLKLFHIRCPTCGMTTAWAYTVRGRLWSAAEANCGGLLLAVLAIVAVPWLLAGAVAWWVALHAQQHSPQLNEGRLPRARPKLDGENVVQALLVDHA